MDEISFLLNMPSSNIIDHKGKKSITIKTQNQEILRISSLLCILVDDSKLLKSLLSRKSIDSN